MNGYNFDQLVNRKNTNAIKVDFNEYYGMDTDVIPMWVADMDFNSPECVRNAILERSRHPIYGYTMYGDDYVTSVKNFMERRHHYTMQKEWLVHSPGVVFGIAAAIRAWTNPGDSVMIQTPVYAPFANMIHRNDRVLVKNSLVYDGSRYVMDYDKLEQDIMKHHVKLFLLCSPHNPIGRVWTKEELIHLGDILVKHNVRVVSDEIHMDFVYPGSTHYVFAGLKNEFEQCTMTCTAPSKTFNLAGLQISNMFIANESLRKLVKDEINKTGYDEPNIYGPIACMAAYNHGEEWLDALLVYLMDNINFVRDFLKDHMPKVHMVQPEGTYLVWLDFRAYGMDTKQLNNKIIKKAKLWLDAGEIFGEEGNGFQRINIATSREVISQALHQLAAAFEE